MNFASIVAVLLFVTLTGCRTPATDANQKDAAVTEESNPNPVACRWAKATTYKEFENLFYYKYDLPDNEYALAQITANKLTSDQVLEDLACLRWVFTNLYSGTQIFRAQGIDLVQNLDKAVTSYLPNKKSTSRVAMAYLIKQLWGTAFDGHGSINFYSVSHSVKGAYLGFGVAPAYPIFVHSTEGIPTGVSECEGMHLVERWNGSIKVPAFVGYLPGNTKQIPATVSCTKSSGESISIPIKSKTAKDAVVRTQTEKEQGAKLETRADGTQILSIYSFPNPATDEQKRIAQIIATSDSPLLIDARGVGGGTPHFNALLKQAMFATSENVVYSKATTNYSWLKGASLTQVYKGMIKDIMLDEKRTSEQKAKDRASVENDMAVWSDGLIKEGFPELKIKNFSDFAVTEDDVKTEGKRSTPRKSPVVILTDRNCGSQCDFFVSAYRHLPTVKGHIMGIPTAGRLNFGNNTEVFLPHSRIELHPSGASNVHLPQVVEGEGVQPNIFIFDNAREQGLSYLKQLVQTQK